MGERLPSETNEKELGLLMAGITEGGGMMEKMPAWADVVLVPLISLLLAAADFCLGDHGDRRRPGGRCKNDGIGRAWLHLWLGLHIILRHKFYVYRPSGLCGVSR